MRNWRTPVLGAMIAIPVVVFVVAVLFPIFARSGDGGGRRAKCLNNLKQCAQALKLYADDYNGQMPSSYFVRQSKQWSKTDSLYFCTRRGKTPSSMTSPRRTWAEALYNHLKSPDIVFCPSDSVDTEEPQRQGVLLVQARQRQSLVWHWLRGSAPLNGRLCV